MIVNITEFMNKYTSASYGFGAYIPTHIYNKVLSKSSAFAELPDDATSQIELEKAHLEARDHEYAVISRHWRNGLDYEIKSDFADAAKEYQKGIRLAESSMFDFSHIAATCKDRLSNVETKLQPICYE